MELKKLTAKEIIDILIENTDLSNFDEGICSTNEPKGFVPSEELAEKIKLNKKYEKEWEYNGKSWDRDDKHYINKKAHRYPSDLQKKEYHNFLGLGNVEFVDRYGGEDCGSEYWTIYYFKDHDVYLKVEGWYQSFRGVEYDSFGDCVIEVKPKTKTVTVYE